MRSAGLDRHNRQNNPGPETPEKEEDPLSYTPLAFPLEKRDPSLSRITHLVAGMPCSPHPPGTFPWRENIIKLMHSCTRLTVVDQCSRQLVGSHDASRLHDLLPATSLREAGACLHEECKMAGPFLTIRTLLTNLSEPTDWNGSTVANSVIPVRTDRIASGDLQPGALHHDFTPPFASPQKGGTCSSVSGLTGSPPAAVSCLPHLSLADRSAGSNSVFSS